MYVPCMIVRFQGVSTPNPRNHPHRIHTYIPYHTITLHYITLHYITLHTYIHAYTYQPTQVHTYYTQPTPQGGGRGSRGTLHDSWIPGR